MIEFNVPPCVGTEVKYVKDAIASHKISGDGSYTRRCSSWMEAHFKSKKVLLTISGTAALEMAALLCKIEPGDEVIMPSYTFTSTANAFTLRGAKIVFVDIRPDTMNLDEARIEEAITEKTKVIVVVHYAGVACEMNQIMQIAHAHKLLVVEDAAQGVMSTYQGRALGTIGDIGCFSFHETKNYSMGEGGALLLQNDNLIEEAEIIREKGTDRSRFFRGQVDKYTWVNVGSSYLPSEINAAYLWGELEKADYINENRLATWNYYHACLEQLEEAGCICRPVVPKDCVHNAHMYYIKTKDLAERTALIVYLKKHEVQAVFHYIPLHASKAGRKFGVFSGEDIYTTRESERLVRLPLYYGMTEQERHTVITAVWGFYRDKLTKKKLAIIGASDFQNPLIEKAKELGYETHVFAWKCGDAGEQTADVFYPISTVDKEAILKQCQQIGIDAITSIASDIATNTVNYVADRMGLTGNSLECTRMSTNKYAMRSCFREAGIPVPEFAHIASDTDYSLVRDLKYPLIVKPTDRSGSRAVTKVYQERELHEAIKAAQQESFEHCAIVEEFIEGVEYSLEGISSHGEHHFLEITKKATTGEPHFIETGHIEPAELSEELCSEIYQVAKQAITALGITDSATHTEFRITPSGEIRIIEIGARMGGDCIGSDLVGLSTGYDYIKMVIDVAFGRKLDWSRIRQPKAALIRFIMQESDKELLNRLRTDYAAELHYVSPLQDCTSHAVSDSATRYGYYIVTSEQRDRIRWILDACDK